MEHWGISSYNAEVSSEPVCIETYPFIQSLFEDLTLSLGYQGCRFHGFLDYVYITVLTHPVQLKTDLFLLFYDLSQRSPELDILFTISHIEHTVKWIFRSRWPLEALRDARSLPHWKEDYHLIDDVGFWLELPAGPLQTKDLPFDRDKARELYLDDRLIDQVLTQFIQRCRTLLVDLRDAILAMDRERIFRLAHTVKGSARNVLALRISAEAFQLEKLSGSASTEALLQRWDTLSTRFEEFLDFLGYNDANHPRS